MDINKFLANAQGGAAVSSTTSEDEPTERNVRIDLHKRRNLKMTSGISDGRALRAIQNDERRKSCRSEKLSSKRQIPGNEEHEAFDENEENDIQENVSPEPKSMKRATNNDRREKLKAYLTQKTKLEQIKRKKQKPAFRPSGKVHHVEGPAGAHKPNSYNVGVGTSRLTNIPNVSRNASTLLRTNSTISRNTPTLSRASGTRGASAVLRSNSALARSKPSPAPKKIDVAGSKAALGARPKAADIRQTRARGAKPIVSPKKPIKPPAICVDLPEKSSSESNSSTSFAPQDFKFSMSLVISTGSSSSESEMNTSVIKRSSTRKASTSKAPAFPPSSTPVHVLGNKMVVPVMSQIEKPTEQTARHEFVSSLLDDVFTEQKEESEVAEDSNTIDMNEIDKEIAKSAMKNRAAKKMERSPVIPHFALNEDVCNSDSSQDELEVVTALEPEKEKNPDEKDVYFNQEEDKGISRGRTRKGKRLSGVQPDPALTEVELAKTPAKRAKERSRSSDRRSKIGQCLFCFDHTETEDHDHSYNEDKNIILPVRTPSKTQMKTPCKTPRVSRKSTLPVLSETSPSQEEGEVKEMDGSVARRRTRNRSAKADGIAQALELKTDTDEEVVDKGEERKKRRSRARKSKSAVDVAEASREVNKKMEVDSENAEKTEVRRSMRFTPAQKNGTIDEEIPDPVRATRRRGKAIEDLAKNFENATLTCTKKPVNKSATPETKAVENIEFKTPSLPVVRSVVKTSQSASKVQVSPFLDKSPWIDFARRSSGKKRKSMSEGKPRKSDLSTMFDDIPDDSASPIHEILTRKAKSSEDLDLVVEAELKPKPPKQMRLSAQFDSIAEDQEKVDKIKNSGEKMTMSSKKQVLHLGNVCTAEVHFDFFRKEYEKESKRIDKVCTEWEKKLEELTGVPEEVLGQIRSVIGQGRIMIARKGRFKQFATLVENCEFQLGEQKTTCMDLQGFWDMVHFQVEDVHRKFEDLRKLEATNWLVVVSAPEAQKIPLVRKPVKNAAPANRKATSSPSTKPKMSKIQEMMAVRRAALAAKRDAPEIRLNVPTEDGEDSEEEKTFDAGFFNIKSPVRSPKSAEGSPQRSDKNKSRERNVSGGDKLRRAVLTESARRLSGFSPMVSAMAKRSMSREAMGEGSSCQTSPVKDSTRSSLFDDLEEDEINEEKVRDTVKEAVKKSPVMIDPIAPLSSPVTKTYGRRVGSPAQKQREIDAFDAMVSSGVKVEETGVEEDGLDGKYFMTATPTESLPSNIPVGTKWSTSSEEVKSSLMESAAKKRDSSSCLRETNPRVSILPGMKVVSPPVIEASEVDMMHFETPPPVPALTPRRSARRSQI